MSDIRSFKCVENKVHEELHNNLNLLKYVYTTTPEFDYVFKKHMFAKSNKTAFYETVYYLLNILNPGLTKERLTAWPTYDIKRANQFRTEVLNYINEINDLYEHANIPKIMASNLISPGGYKFANFMFKLSQLVLLEHLKEHGVELLYCPEANKNVDITKEMLNNFTIISHIESTTKEKLNRYHEYHKRQEEKALSIVNTLNQLDKSISVLKKEQAMAEEEFYKKYTVYPSNDSLKNKLVTLNKQWECLEHIHTSYEECENLLHYINNTNLVIDLDDETEKTTNHKEQDLPEFFNTLTHLINSKSLVELPNPNSFHLQQNSEKICEVIDKFAIILKEMSVNTKQIQLLIIEMNKSVRFVKHLIANQPKLENVFDDLGIKPLEYSGSE